MLQMHVTQVRDMVLPVKLSVSLQVLLLFLVCNSGMCFLCSRKCVNIVAFIKCQPGTSNVMLCFPQCIKCVCTKRGRT